MARTQARGSRSRGTTDELAERARAEVVVLADRAAELAARARTEAAPYVERARVEAAPYVERVQAETAVLVAAAAPLVGSAVETVTGVLEDAGTRGGAAWAALRSEEAAPATTRRWPWALGAALAGAAGGAAMALLAGRLRTEDAPDALEPDQVQAVVDRPDGVVAPR